jgi:hypothetical protein
MDWEFAEVMLQGYPHAHLQHTSEGAHQGTIPLTVL